MRALYRPQSGPRSTSSTAACNLTTIDSSFHDEDNRTTNRARTLLDELIGARDKVDKRVDLLLELALQIPTSISCPSPSTLKHHPLLIVDHRSSIRSACTSVGQARCRRAHARSHTLAHIIVVVVCRRIIIIVVVVIGNMTESQINLGHTGR